MRYGCIPAFPDGIAYPQTDEDVAALIELAQTADLHLIPYGGGTSVVGHINPEPGSAPVLTVDMGRMKRLHRFDETSQLATFGAGINGPELEAQLRARGFTLGHFPQSFELSTLGGWVATRSSGQQSLAYGRIEQLFVGGKVISPAGKLIMPDTFPASAAGPDLRQIILGSEGRLGIITEATVKVTPLPEREDFHAVFFPDFEAGQTAVRQIIQSGLPLSMMRLSTGVETTTTLALAGHERMINMLEQMLSLRSVDEGKCLLLLGFTGGSSLMRLARRETLSICRDHDGVHVGRTFGEQWHKGRFRTPYLRYSLWQMGFAVVTLETAVSWQHTPALLDAIENALHSALADMGEKVHVFTHLSHVYPTGSSIYTTYLFRLGKDADETLARWRLLKTAASQAIIAHRGTISHQHGVGTDHLPYLAAEKGAVGIEALHHITQHFDPQGVMNPGKLIGTATS
jgi:alkyldihydroxyacetonephosphate synthase